ncbi:hypothetical protein OHJ28_12435 [Dickeya fangzhongdai]
MQHRPGHAGDRKTGRTCASAMRRRINRLTLPDGVPDNQEQSP